MCSSTADKLYISRIFIYIGINFSSFLIFESMNDIFDLDNELCYRWDGRLSLSLYNRAYYKLRNLWGLHSYLFFYMYYRNGCF